MSGLVAAASGSVLAMLVSVQKAVKRCVAPVQEARYAVGQRQELQWTYLLAGTVAQADVLRFAAAVVELVQESL